MSHPTKSTKKKAVVLNNDTAQQQHTKLDRSPSTTNKATVLRVLAPFVRISRKFQRPQEEESEKFSFYLRKKPNVLIRDLSSFLSDSVDLPSLLHETSDVLQNVTKASAVSLYLTNAATDEIHLSVRQGAPEERYKIKWRIQPGTIVAAYVAHIKQYVLIEDILQEHRFPEGVGYEGGINIKSVLSVPIVTQDGDCVAVIELYRHILESGFTKDDLKITLIVTGWMATAIHLNQQRLALKKQQELNDYLLNLTKCYFGDNVLIEKMIREVVKFARVTLGAERGSFFIIDRDSDELVADLFDEVVEGETTQHKKPTKVRFGRERGIAGLVAKTGVTVNIKDAYNDTRFNKEIDQKTGFITRSILCMPIRGVDGILGVVQVVNKKNGGCFTATDEILFQTFSVYCALALHYTKMQTQYNKSILSNNIALKLLKLQQKPCIHDLEYVERLTDLIIPQDFDTFQWYLEPENHLQIPSFCLYMILSLVDESQVHIKNMIEFILTVRKFYRKNSYHNFEHAFNVCHSMYVILKQNINRFTDIEIKALFIAALCHDIDHAAFTNTFLQLVNDDLARLYEGSLLENHHVRVTMSLLDGSKIFQDMPEESYKLLHREVRTAIMATDLALYFKCKSRLVNLCKEDAFDWSDNEHRDLIKSIMMTSCDMSGQCKPFSVAKRITEQLYHEFYNQGDLEKARGLCPLPIMDRDKRDQIPQDQVQFLSVIVIPCTDILRTLLPNTDELYQGAVTLRNSWQEAIDLREKKCWRQEDSIVTKQN